MKKRGTGVYLKKHDGDNEENPYSEESEGGESVVGWKKDKEIPVEMGA